MKLIKTILISIFVIILLTQNILAVEDIIGKGEDWLETGKEHTSTTMDSSLLERASTSLYNLLLAVATIVAIIVGAILGIQYMTAGINRKVEVKESLFPYIVSCLVVFGSLGIWKLVVTIMGNL